jgi:TRAP-type C4-dicarboxylate transport system permease small subunit
MLRLANIMRTVNRWWSHLGEVCIAALMIIITVDVLLRICLNSPILGAYEICQLLLSVVIFTSFAYLQSEKGHVSVNLLIDRFPPKVRSVILCIDYLVATAFAAVWAYGAWLQGVVYMTSGNTTALLKLPYPPFYFIEAISMALFCIVLLIDTLTLIGALFNEELAAEVATWEGGSND